MTLLVAVKSCIRDAQNDYNQAIRDTWGADAVKRGCELKFFVGTGEANLFPDEVQVEALDDYTSLPYKTIEICKWFLTSEHEHIFLCDTDTFVRVDRLLACDFSGHDYTGYFSKGPKEIGRTFSFTDSRNVYHPICHPWASGGGGYFLSRRAAELVSKAQVNTWAEDLMVGQVLGPSIQAGTIKAFCPTDYWGYVTVHLKHSSKYRHYCPEWMRELYRNENSPPLHRNR